MRNSVSILLGLFVSDEFQCNIQFLVVRDPYALHVVSSTRKDMFLVLSFPVVSLQEYAKTKLHKTWWKDKVHVWSEPSKMWP